MEIAPPALTAAEWVDRFKQHARTLPAARSVGDDDLDEIALQLLERHPNVLMLLPEAAADAYFET
ncbi:MAG: hypothetical protein H0W40_08955 [Methylibium sp.]|uniref:hypothetical protein n=1 Tax=Methylibium sp. TaxID=2067992 RepID=UPI00184F8E8F|nr:hypothetical protein [Methylibium sp.]MBA3597494.1 hypothetical protein [Methylibium sp.]